MSYVAASISLAGSGAVMESDQDKTAVIVVATPKKEFYIPRNAVELRSRARNHAVQLSRLQWSVEETCKFASAEFVLSKIYK